MSFVAIASAVLVVPYLLVSACLALVVRLRRGAVGRFVRRALVVLAVLLPLHLLVVVPAVLGWLGAHRTGTRSFERGYRGPHLGPGGILVDPLRIEASDGTGLRIFHVPARTEPPTAGSWVIVHGLFRNALELEPVAEMLQDLGAEVVMLELRNHGGSDRAPPTFGLHESRDVLAAVRWLRETRGRDRIALFGVSLGSIAVALAAPEAPELRAVVLDAPIDDLAATASRMLARGPRRAPSMSIPWPIRDLAIDALQLWTGFDLDEVRPYEAMRNLRPDVDVLLIGAGEDFRVPPRQVRALADSLPTDPAHKAVWIREGSTHGHVWIDDPAGYREHLQRITDRLR